MRRRREEQERKMAGQGGRQEGWGVAGGATSKEVALQEIWKKGESVASGEGRKARGESSRSCIHHLLLLQAKKAQEEQKQREKREEKVWERIPVARHTS